MGQHPQKSLRFPKHYSYVLQSGLKSLSFCKANRLISLYCQSPLDLKIRAEFGV